MRPERCNSFCTYPGGAPACMLCGWPRHLDRGPTATPPEGAPPLIAPPADAALRIYDIRIDAWRGASQVDIDCLGAVGVAYGKLRVAFDQVHAELQKDVTRIRSQAGVPA